MDLKTGAIASKKKKQKKEKSPQEVALQEAKTLQSKPHAWFKPSFFCFWIGPQTYYI